MDYIKGILKVHRVHQCLWRLSQIPWMSQNDEVSWAKCRLLSDCGGHFSLFEKNTEYASLHDFKGFWKFPFHGSSQNIYLILCDRSPHTRRYHPRKCWCSSCISSWNVWRPRRFRVPERIGLDCWSSRLLQRLRRPSCKSGECFQETKRIQYWVDT